MAERSPGAYDGCVDARTVKQCDSCKTTGLSKRADLICKTCEEYLCSDCITGHILSQTDRKHVIIDVRKVNDQAVDMMGMDKCELHGKLVNYYCADHDCLCCNTCALVTGPHRQCNDFRELDNDNSKITESSLKLKMNQIKFKSERLLKHYTQVENEMEKQIGVTENKLDASKMKVLTRFKSIQGTLSTEANSNKNKVSQAIVANRPKSGVISSDTENDLKWFNTIITTGNRAYIFMATHTLEKKDTTNQTELASQQDRLSSFKIGVGLNRSLQTLTDAETDLGTLNVESSIGRPVKLVPKTSVDVKGADGDRKEPFYTGLAFISDNRIVVVDNLNMKCRILNEDLKVIGSSYSAGYSLFSACAVSDNTVAVTAQNQIDILQVSSSNDITLVKTLETTSKYNSISMINDTTFAVSTWDDPRPVRMVTLDGVESDFTNITFPDKKYTIGESKCTYIPGRDTVVLTDRFDHTVYMYNTKDNTKHVIKDDCIKGPGCACVGNNDSIFVCSKNTNSIVHISPTGKIIGAHKVDMDYPYAICVSKDGTKMAVSNNYLEKRKLILYQCVY